MPVEVGVVEEELDPVALAGLGQHLEYVPLIRRPLDNIVVAHLAVPHREPVMVLARDRDIAHAGGLGDPAPLIRVETYGIELRRQLFVVRNRDVFGMHHPFAAPRTLYTPQWMNIPNFASWNHSRAARFSGAGSVFSSRADLGRQEQQHRSGAAWPYDSSYLHSDKHCKINCRCGHTPSAR